MATCAPHHWAVVSRELAFRRAPIKGIAADATHVVASFPRPYSYSVPLLDLYFERHLAADKKPWGPKDGWMALLMEGGHELPLVQGLEHDIVLHRDLMVDATG
jgi:hypothetical protein